MPSPLSTGFLALHGNQLEELRAAVFGWCRAHPLAPLEQEIFLVQSNGVAEWLKIAMAEELGVCAATRVTLPGRFLWEAYRGMLGKRQVARRSALDKSTLTWRLMRLLPSLLTAAEFAPLQRFLADGDPERSLQLAQRLADLLDQYQVYRADWLGDWAHGRDVLQLAQGKARPLADDQVWQASLWRAILASIPPEEHNTGRAAIHQQFMRAAAAATPPVGTLPRRVIVFGISALPYQTLEALSALSTRMQVIIAVPNPCRYYWGDIMEGRELFKAQHRRQALRGERDLSSMPMEELHAHSHPLLAGWGRLGRDFIRMLDEFDEFDGRNETQAPQSSLATLRVDLFGEDAGAHLLGQVQAAVRDLLPLQEHPRLPVETTDRSIVFHMAHSVQREVEILHDQLLGMFAAAEDPPLQARDVIVMVPDIASFAPAIRAVFGQTSRHDERMIPFEIADVGERQIKPLLLALEWLLKLPQQRCLQSEIRDLLDVPALAARFGLTEADLPRLAEWITGAGVRWGLNTEHRASLGLGAAGEQNAWLFGIQRMLLGYANGDSGSYAGIEPYAEVGGLDAALAGALADLIEKLIEWRRLLASPASPAVWAERARLLLAAFFKTTDEADRLTLTQLEQALQTWLEDCEVAQFDAPVSLAIVREAWMNALDEPQLNQRFVSGGVTFCTLMPMRAVPFRVVCLLGMNDGDYPRRSQHVDFDLLALPGVARAGDRSRRDDDRYLMLEALLAARDHLYISWVGRSVRDNTAQPPSVLVAQLRDYLKAGWQLDLAQLTTEHPLQPFSRRYFEVDGLPTFAREWRAAHEAEVAEVADVTDEARRSDPLPAMQLGIQQNIQQNMRTTLKQADLARFCRQPVKYFFRHRLQVDFDELEGLAQDQEPFRLNGLDNYQLTDRMLDDSGAQESVSEINNRLRERAERIAREGLLPIGRLGKRWQDQMVSTSAPARRAWLDLWAAFPLSADKRPLTFDHQGVRLEDWLDKCRSDGSSTAWLELEPSVFTVDGKISEARAHKLIKAWIRQLAAAALGHVVTGYLVTLDAVIILSPMDRAQAHTMLADLLVCWKDGLDRPLPTACKTALALLSEGKPWDVYDGTFTFSGEGEDGCLARLWDDYASLASEPEWESCSRALYGPLLEWYRQYVTVAPHDLSAQESEAA